MKRFLATLLLAIQVSLPAFGADLSTKDAAALTEVIDQCNAAFFRSDASGIADVTADRLLQAVGGRDKYVESVQGGIKAAQSTGLKLVSHHGEPPTAPVKADGFLVVIVKETNVMEARGKQFRSEGFTVAVRPAAGGRWKLIGGNGISQNPGIVAMLYPGFPADYKFPPYTTTPL